MALVFKNYKATKIKHEELVEVRILDSEDILADLPFALAEFNKEYKNPVIFGDIGGIPRILEASFVLEKTKMLYLKEGSTDEKTQQSRLIEVSKDESDIQVRLPIDTPVDNLMYVGGQVLLAEPQQ